jgi:hypothetical protein
VTGIRVTTDSDTLRRQCFRDNPDAERGELVGPVEAGDSWEGLTAEVAGHQAAHGCGAAPEPAVPEMPGGDGQWQVISFFGHAEYTGWVTEITKHGQPAYRIDMPEKVFGGDPLAYVTHAASSWFSDRPVTEAFVRKAWQERQERARLRAEQEAEWRALQQRQAIEAGDGEDDTDNESEPF